VRYRQTYAGLEVFGAGMIIEVDATGGVSAVSSDIMRDTEILDTGEVSLNPSIDCSGAQNRAIEFLVASYPQVKFEANPCTLKVFSPTVVGNPGQTQLVWQTEVGGVDGYPREMVFIDAHNGSIAFHYSLIVIR
jgi:hypothetical protein